MTATVSRLAVGRSPPPRSVTGAGLLRFGLSQDDTASATRPCAKRILYPRVGKLVFDASLCPRASGRSNMHSFRTDRREMPAAFEAIGEADDPRATGSPVPIGEGRREIEQVGERKGFPYERREYEPPRVIGHLVSLNGTQGVISCRLETSEEDWSVGHLITIVHRTSRLVGVVCDIGTNDGRWSETDVNTARVTIELSGEIFDDASGAPVFCRGVSSFPSLGAAAHRIRADDLRAIYSFRGGQGVEIGKLSQNDIIPAEIDVGELIGRHFAVLGSTGVGKTTAVSLLLRKSVAMRPKLRVIIFDPHNEYAAHFSGLAQIIDFGHPRAAVLDVSLRRTRRCRFQWPSAAFGGTGRAL